MKFTSRGGQVMFCRSLVLSALLTLSAFGAPVPREELYPPVPLAGSVWSGDGVVAPTTYEFHADGRISMSYQGTRHQNIGTWRQDGRKVYWESCEKYCEFEGTITGTTITGRSWNKPGGKWTLTVKRVTAGP